MAWQEMKLLKKEINKMKKMLLAEKAAAVRPVEPSPTVDHELCI